MEILQKNIFLLIHCLRDDNSPQVISHPELFLHVAEVDDLIRQLGELGYEFCSIEQAINSNRRTCTITFDDGYFNNTLFLPLAKKYNLPFVVFVNSLNVKEQKPYIWDLDYLRDPEFNGIVRDYRVDYGKIDRALSAVLMSNSSHRPFTENELYEFSSNQYVNIGLHTHSHQVLTDKYLQVIQSECEDNIEFLKKFPNFLSRDLALPCGLYTDKTLKKLHNFVDRIYTIDHSENDLSIKSPSLIHRVSLVNPDVGGPLISQLVDSTSRLKKIKRKIVNLLYSNRLFQFF